MAPPEGEGREPRASAATVRAAIAGLETSRIRRVVSHAMGRPGVIPLWFGEPDEPTPGFIIAAARRALEAGETFYTLNRGIPALRTAIADYLHGLRGRPISEARISVTASGMNAIMMTMQALLGPGDTIVMPEPYWPNIPATVEIVGAAVRTVPLAVRGNAFVLDLERLFDRVDGATRAILINSPANPTGWMMTAEDQRAVLDFCRVRGLWLIADEVYDRITYTGAPAPSFLDCAEPEDALVVINSFSKSWAMTGWRVGWLVTPERLGPQIDKLIEYNIACAPAMAQRAAITALAEGEPFIAASVARYRGNRDLVVDRLAANPRIRLTRPPGAFYAFLAVDGITDSLRFAVDLVDETGVGLAPGSAFGESGEGHLRLCFASARERLSEALDRLEAYLNFR